LGGRVFPGVFERSRFDINETDSTVSVQIVRTDGGKEISFSGHISGALPESSIFPSIAEAAGFFSLGATGYSATRSPDHFHGMELRSRDWTIQPLAVDEAHSCFFDDERRFPKGTKVLDSALLMRGIEHEWHSRPDLYLADDGHSLTTRS